ncbi:MAG: NAD+ synthase [Acidobacteria bacterium]|nr:NAD+ synthase [Acidobacteriota bacterium]
MRLALGQINPTVGDFDGNSQLILEQARQAVERGAELALFPELSLCGYPPRDLIEIPAFLERNWKALDALAEASADLDAALIVGFVGPSDRPDELRAANCAAVLEGGQVRFVQRKMLLPTYDVFDEWRYFAPAVSQQVCEIRGRRVGLTICEDFWNDKEFWRSPRYPVDPVEELARQGADLLVNIASSPYHMGKRSFREEMLRSASLRHRVPTAMVNQVGGNDQLVFDGSSFAIGADGTLLARGRSFEPEVVLVDLEAGRGDLFEPSPEEPEAVYDALVLGTRDYVRKCGFSNVVIGLSGGIDSSLTAAVAVEALGAENVLGVAMPGPYSSEGSLVDARALAAACGIRFEVVSINPAYKVFLETLSPVFGHRGPDVTEENLQARLRGATLMALSNKFGALVLTTGNKSEIAVGYCTLYGDMVGGLAVISDVPKTLVYELCRVANRRKPGIIPQTVFDKPPSAELRADQKDTDSLPPYEVLDPLLRLYVEERIEPATIARELELPPQLVRDICRMVDRNEYKRQQAAPGLRVTSKAFGVGRRLPIAQRFTP